MEPLADPLDDRMWKEIIPPPVLPLATSLLFPSSGNDEYVINASISIGYIIYVSRSINEMD